MIQLRERVGLNSSLLLVPPPFHKAQQWKTRDWEKRKVRVRKSLVFATILLSLHFWKFCFSSHVTQVMHICIIIIMQRILITDFQGRCLKRNTIGKLSQTRFFLVHHLSFMVMSADWCTSSSQVCMSSTSVLTPFEKSCMHNKLQNLFSKGHGCTPFYVSKKAKKLFFCFQKSQTFKSCRL